MENFFRNLIKFSRTISDFNIQIFLIIFIPLTRTSVYKFCNRPLSVVFEPIVIWWRHKPDVAKLDNAHYFASCRNRPGLYGRGNYTKFPIVKTTEVYSIEIEELMKDRLRTEPNFFMGTREEVLAHIKNVKNEDFDNALTMAHYRITGLQNNVEDFANSLANPQTAFRHWLATQVANGKISSIDGYVFVQRSAEAPMKNCEVGDFLYKYYDSFESARKLGIHESYRNVDTLTKHLLGQILKESLGVGPVFKFEEINTLIRDRHNAATTTAECYPLIASEPTIPQDKIAMESEDNLTDEEYEEAVVDTHRELLEDVAVMAIGLSSSDNPHHDLLQALVPPVTKEKEQSVVAKLIELGAIDNAEDLLFENIHGETIVSIKNENSNIQKMTERQAYLKPMKTAKDINHPKDYGVKGIATENVNDESFVEVSDLTKLTETSKRNRPSTAANKTIR